MVCYTLTLCSIKVRSLDDTSLVTNVVDVEDAQNNLDGLAWSGDEQLLAVSLKDGKLFVRDSTLGDFPSPTPEVT